MVELVYRPGFFDVMYMESDGMGYRERSGGRREIHERYRKVVDEMVNAIAITARSPAIASVADEGAPAGQAIGRGVSLEDLPLGSPKQ